MTDAAGSSAISYLLERLPREEGDRRLPYDDATGLEVRAPKGNLSWGRGFNLEAIGSTELFNWMAGFLVQQMQNRLLELPWYASINSSDPIRASVFLDIAYNEGLHGLLGFPSMIHYATVGDWQNAAIQCDISRTNPAVDRQRYAPLRQILATGQVPNG